MSSAEEAHRKFRWSWDYGFGLCLGLFHFEYTEIPYLNPALLLVYAHHLLQCGESSVYYFRDLFNVQNFWLDNIENFLDDIFLDVDF